ncbi:MULTISPECIES: hypothetical protein [Paenibacillus]|uniref:Uncharacterized protein n=1 Tax=Paenibacillus glycanilyticus TaxID=126569 RepID=A0ABQ6G3X8_9BACL|nr:MULTISPECIES: hypothetical protein [Paenibacillus]ACT03550.1 hypothetical protein Pjdr2_4939 [Paenibacillus sp. JDR-2]GLX65664.1 hypothetical protein MU1_00080 [Paenibacillus glycanilyticus]
MGLGDYQFILYPIGNSSMLTEEGMEFIGPYYFNFVQAVNELKKIDKIKNDPTLKSWNSFDDACYFLYNDEQYKVEIELNAGTVSEQAEMISVRTNYYKEEGSITEALHICRELCNSLNLSCWSMKLRRIIDLNEVQDVETIISNFNKLRNKS